MANLKSNNFKQSTLAIHAGYTYDKERTLSVPIYQNTAYNFESLNQAANRFALKELGNIYTRLSNPTSDILGARLAAVEGGAFGTVASSGTAAVFHAIVNCAQNGDNIAYSNKIYGGTQTLFEHTLKRFGIEGRVFDIDNIEESLNKIIDKNTKAIFFESISNPQLAIADTEKITKIAKENGIISICDNTVSAFLHDSFKFGADLSVHSLTKYVNGHGNALGGAVIERKGLNSFIKNNPRYPAFNTPDASYHGLVYADLELPFFSIRIITEWLRNIGATISPHNAWLLLQGLETLDIRIQKISQNALEIAEFLESNKKIKGVNYPALKNNKYNHLLKKYYKDSLASGLISFEAESFEAAKNICNNAEIFSITANIGDSKSLIIHPASTTHSQLSQDELKSAGINPATVRLSIGLESSTDLIADLSRAIDTAS